MANLWQLKRLRKGTNVWNRWRANSPKVLVNLSQADLNHENLNGVNLSGANLRESRLSSIYLTGANLSEADLSYASLGLANLDKANLQGAQFRGADLNLAILSGANLRGVNFREANLIDANLSETDLRNAKLYSTNLKGVNLTGADLTGADLGHAYIQSAKLAESKFSGTLVGHTTFGNLDLSNVIGLDDAQHHGPSSISTDVFACSKGKIPTSFLRGCGLSDLDIERAKLSNPGLDPEQVTDITYKIHQLYLGGGIQYYSCFISYNNNDETFVRQLHDDLQNNGVRCWFAPENMKIGDRIRITIDQQIRTRDKLLVILSDNSIKSEWVGDEVEAALEEETISNRTLLFPIRLDDTVMCTRDDWAAKIKRRRHIGDFSNWKDKASYQRAFERLLRDLKATGGGVNGE